MENNNYFAEMMKSPMPRETEKTVISEFIDSFLSDILYKKEKAALMEKIDLSLDQGDRLAFITLSNELNRLEKTYKVS
ncbi:IDEAL domain-containing protein [Domibacillus sp. A3M-37]|uniref:IDEAL domain-containing protein n=1 Tax=Domibacillus sp. A3M-37 TaxID=2962037 RepID=UPI0020B80965|nr:IDEAL domain-containing protein [Domibacillus sp. A3M-37]MCP3761621.1 IDEAL domain-containing protein [Domibacillus sp. A3M-37]